MANKNSSSAASFLSIIIFLILSPTPICNADDNILYSGETLNSTRLGENQLVYGNYSFRMQRDCNLVLYDNNHPIWASGTYGVTSNCYCTLLPTGNLVIYRRNGVQFWATNSALSHGKYVLVLQENRNVLIYGPARWATSTGPRASNIIKSGQGSAYGGGIIYFTPPHNATTDAAVTPPLNTTNLAATV